MIITQIEINNGFLFFDPPVKIIELDINNNYYIANSNYFELIVKGKNFSELYQDFIKQIYFIWNEYVIVDKSSLTKDAQDLRNNLLKNFKHK